jgi:ferredoxin-NADP reductase
MTSTPSTLTVLLKHRRTLADDTVELTFQARCGTSLPPWDPGAHIDVVGPNGLVRQYSLCGHNIDRSTFRVAVLRERDGRGGSASIVDNLTVDDEVKISAPRNHFNLEVAAQYRFIAGGIGITPILAMIRHLGESADWRLLYGGRSRTTMAYLHELEASYPDRLVVRPEDESGLLPIQDFLADRDPNSLVYCCGPTGLLDAIEKQATEWPDATQLHVERFTPKNLDNAPAEREFIVELAQSGREIPVPVGTSIADALEHAGVPVYTSCREGTCGTCETAVISGEIDHRDSILSDSERRENKTMMLCVSRCRSGRLILDH